MGKKNREDQYSSVKEKEKLGIQEMEIILFNLIVIFHSLQLYYIF
jgi:hypothetical protein